MTPDALVVHHGDLWYGNMLVEDHHITGLLDFEQLSLGDQAVDFVPQLYLGEQFFSWVVEAYTRAGGELSPHFQHRVRQLFAVREFSGLHWAVEHHDAEEFRDSLVKIRKGPILNPAWLDGWHRDFGTA